MQVIDAVTLEESGFTVQVVEPGSADDPFTARNQHTSPALGASPANLGLIGGVQMVQSVDGPQVQTPPPVSTPSPAAPAAPVAQPPAPLAAPATPAPELSPMQKAIQDGALDTYVAGLVNESVGKALRSQQSSYDKRIDALEQELGAAREATLKAEREGKLEGLTEDEQQTLRDKWALEDERQQLNAEINEADVYFHSLYVAATVQEYAQYGVTAEDLEQIEEPEEIDVFVREKELEYYRSGAHLKTEIPTRTVESSAAQPIVAPAGAQAPTDVGGGAPSNPPAKFDESVGLDAMARNLNNLPWQSLPMPN